MMKLEILLPEKVLYSGDIHLVSVPGTQGSFEIMDRHAAILSTLEAGRVKVITKEGDEKFFEINGGFVEVKDNRVVIVAS